MDYRYIVDKITDKFPWWDINTIRHRFSQHASFRQHYRRSNWKAVTNLYEIFKQPFSYDFMKIFHWSGNGLTLFMDLDLDNTRFSIFARYNFWEQKMSELRFVQQLSLLPK